MRWSFFARLACAVIVAIAITLGCFLLGAPVNAAAFWGSIIGGVAGTYVADWLPGDRQPRGLA